MRFSKKIVIALFAIVLAFTITMIVIFCKYQSVPDQLIIAFFAFCSAEAGALSWIKRKE